MADDNKIIFSMFRVGKSFPPHRQVLKDISLSFFLGAKIGIIGLNGSGKSTLLKIIAGMEKEYQGEVTFLPGYSVGHLSQDPLLDENRSVREIVEEGLKETMAIIKEFEEINNSFGEPVCMRILIRCNNLWTGRLYFRKRSIMPMAGILNTSLSGQWMLSGVPMAAQE